MLLVHGEGAHHAEWLRGSSLWRTACEAILSISILVLLSVVLPSGIHHTTEYFHSLFDCSSKAVLRFESGSSLFWLSQQLNRAFCRDSKIRVSLFLFYLFAFLLVLASLAMLSFSWLLPLHGTPYSLPVPLPDPLLFVLLAFPRSFPKKKNFLTQKALPARLCSCCTIVSYWSYWSLFLVIYHFSLFFSSYHLRSKSLAASTLN